MSVPIFLLWLASIPLLFAQSPDSQPGPRRFLINCGASNMTTSGDLTYIQDDKFIKTGNKTSIKKPEVMPIFQDLRFFPDKSARKYCYMIPATRGVKYLVRTSYFYGGYDGGSVPPVFDQIIDGTKWSSVDTREDFAKGLTSYYELVVAATSRVLSVCLARTPETVSDPFISVLEVINLDDSVYNSTNFRRYALGTVARTTFGESENDMIGYPDDRYNRYWHPHVDENPTVICKANVTPSSFWNLPPANAFSTGLTTSRGKTLKIQWPQGSLPESLYYVTLYLQDSRTKSPFSWRVFDIAINGIKFYSGVNVSTDGVSVFAGKWPLSGETHIEMTPGDNIPVGPLINAGEVLQLLPLGRRTLTPDVEVMENLAQTLENPPSDWSGDPCLPKDHSWTGVTCLDGKHSRVVALNLTGIGLSGTLPPTLGNLTALSDLWLGGNKLSGEIPDMKNLKALKTLHLENNQFTGSVPQSLAEIPDLREAFLQNNKLTGGIPKQLHLKKGLDIRV